MKAQTCTHKHFVAMVTMLLYPLPAMAQDDVADIPSRDMRAGKDDQKRFFLIGPRKNTPPPKVGLGLVIVLPGGPGTENFHPFVKRIYKHGIGDGFVAAQLVSLQSNRDQNHIWPTEKNPTKNMKFSTEAFVDAVIKDITTTLKIDPKRVFTLTWSSSGPAGYAVSLTNKKVKGSFIAMSVYKPRFLPPTKLAKGHRYYVYHSPGDRVCPFKMAEQASKDLQMAGAVVKFKSYRGGHGWRGGLYTHIKEGIQFLQQNPSP